MFGGRGLAPMSANQIGNFVMAITIWMLVLEVSVLAARVFRDEVHSHTWPLLAVLPRGLVDISYAKLVGAMLGLCPVAFYFLLGAWLSGDDFGEILEFLLGDPDAMLMLAYTCLQIALFWHLAALLSIVWRWGGLAGRNFSGGCVCDRGQHHAGGVFVIGRRIGSSGSVAGVSVLRGGVAGVCDACADRRRAGAGGRGVVKVDGGWTKVD